MNSILSDYIMGETNNTSTVYVNKKKIKKKYEKQTILFVKTSYILKDINNTS